MTTDEAAWAVVMANWDRVNAGTPKYKVQAALMARIVRSDGHWLWTGEVSKDGAPKFRCGNGARYWNGAAFSALMKFMMPHQDPNRDGVMRYFKITCGVRRCINPQHRARGKDHSRPRRSSLTYEQAVRVYEAPNGEKPRPVKGNGGRFIGMQKGLSPLQQLADEFGLSYEYLRRVRNGRALQKYYERYHGRPGRNWEKDNLDRRMESRRRRKSGNSKRKQRAGNPGRKPVERHDRDDHGRGSGVCGGQGCTARCCAQELG